MFNSKLISTFDIIVRCGLLLTPFLVLMVSTSLIFPYITGKGFFFRITVEILFGFWLALLILDPREYFPRRNILLFAFGIFISAIFLADFFGVNFSKSFWSNYERMEGFILYLHLFAYFLMLVSVFRKELDWRIFFHLSVFVSLIVTAYAYLEKFGSIETMSGSRVFSTVGNPIYLAAYLLMIFFLLFFYFFETLNPRLKILYLLIILFEFPVFLLTETRGALLGLWAGIFAAVSLKLAAAADRRLKIGLVVFLWILVLLPAGLIVFRESDFIKSRSYLERFTSISLADQTARSRLLLWGLSWESWREKPFWGWGQDNFISAYTKNYNPRLYGNEPWFDRSHNTPLQWLVEAGIIGFAAYLFIVIGVLVLLRKIRRLGPWRENQVLAAAGFFFAYFIQSLFVFDTLVTLFLLVGLLGFLQFSALPDRKLFQKEKTGKPPPIRQGDFWAVRLKSGLVFLVIAAFLLVAVFLNLAPIRQAQSIVSSLENLTGRNEVGVMVLGFRDSLKINSFGLSEARLQLSKFLLEAAAGEDFSRFWFQDLLSLGVLEMKKESESDPVNGRPLLLYAELAALEARAKGESFEKAETAYKKVLEISPDYIPAHLALAEFYVSRDNYAEAEKTGEKIFQFGAINRAVYLPLTALYVLTRNYESAWKMLEIRKGLNITPSAEELLRLGKRSFQQEDWTEARRFLEPARKAADENLALGVKIETLLFLAQIETRLGDKAKAAFYVQEAKKSRPDLSEKINLLLENLERAGQNH